MNYTSSSPLFTYITPPIYSLFIITNKLENRTIPPKHLPLLLTFSTWETTFHPNDTAVHILVRSFIYHMVPKGLKVAPYDKDKTHIFKHHIKKR